MIRDNHGRQADHDYLYKLLGIRSQRLPREGFGPIELQGQQLMCVPVGTRNNRRGKPVFHRIYYLCPVCSSGARQRWIPFGRGAQHEAGREHRLNYEIIKGRP